MCSRSSWAGERARRARCSAGAVGLVRASCACVQAAGIVCAARVPDCEVDGTDCLERQTLATVICRRSPHLIPDLLDVARVLTLDETAQVVLDNVASRRTGRRDADARRPVLRLDLHNARAERVDAPRCACSTEDRTGDVGSGALYNMESNSISGDARAPEYFGCTDIGLAIGIGFTPLIQWSSGTSWQSEPCLFAVAAPAVFCTYALTDLIRGIALVGMTDCDAVECRGCRRRGPCLFVRRNARCL